jgi:hypothetical protein
MIMTARQKRFAEYWPPFAVMFSAFALEPWLAGVRSALPKLPIDILQELQPFLDTSEPTSAGDERRELWKTIGLAVVAVTLAVLLFFNVRAEVREIASSEPHEYYKAGAEWQKDNVPPGQIIFNTDWDDFPRLFYYDPTHRYISGLDPSYLYDRDPALSRLYDRVTLGDEEDPGSLIRDRFGARYVFTDNGHDKFYNNAIESGWFDVVYEDRDCTILRIREAKGEPPPEEPDTNDTGDEEPPANSRQEP